MTFRRSIGLFFSLSALSACSGTVPGDLLGPPPDADMSTDAHPEDSAVAIVDGSGDSAGDARIDAPPPNDAGAGDATLPSDATVPEDATALPDASVPDDATLPDDATAPVDAAIDVSVPIDASPADASPIDAGAPPCTWLSHFEELYGHPWSPNDVGFTVSNGTARGIDKLDLNAQRNQSPSVVHLKDGRLVTGIQLYAPNSNQVIATRTNAKYVYGVGHAMWLEVNAYGEAGLTEATLVRQFGMEEPSYEQLTAALRVLTKHAEVDVPAASLADFRIAAANMVSKVEAGQLVFQIGTGHGFDFSDSAQTVNGKYFGFQFSTSLGLDVQLGFESSTWSGQKWRSIAADGSWSATHPGMQPICGGCTRDRWDGKGYLFCKAPLSWNAAEAACASSGGGGHLAAETDAFTEAFARSLAPSAGDTWIGLASQTTPGQFRWSSGASLAYTDWSPGQPSLQTGCVQVLDTSGGSRWRTAACNETRSYVCTLP